MPPALPGDTYFTRQAHDMSIEGARTQCRAYAFQSLVIREMSVYGEMPEKRAACSDRVQRNGRHLLGVRYLPKYSPDLSPIEMSYSKFKAVLRKVAERAVPGLYRTIRSFVPQLGAQECANYFRHAGYVSI
jgi:hypothetical protein